MMTRSDAPAPGQAQPVVRLGTIHEVAELECGIPEFATPKPVEEIARRLDTREALILVAEFEGRPVAFKAGFPLNDTTFYSWIGAVAPQARRQGLARALMQAQERRVQSAGFERIRVESRNAFPGMLRLLIGQGYRIVALEPVPDAADPKIVFEKCLTPVARSSP